MTVKELIEALYAFDSDSKVFIEREGEHREVQLEDVTTVSTVNDADLGELRKAGPLADSDTGIYVEGDAKSNWFVTIGSWS